MLKNGFLIALIFCFATSCSTFKPAATRPNPTQSTVQSDGNVQFITNISIKPDTRQDDTHSSLTTLNKDAKPGGSVAGRTAMPAAIENYPALQFKYAILENCAVE